MIVPEELKGNRFREVAIPSKAEYMTRYGLMESETHFTGDEIPPERQRTTDNMRDFDAWDAEMQREAEKSEGE